jgi:ATP:ADP antiporter, AAA family
MFQKIKETLWGDLSGDEFKRIGLLSVTLFFIIGSYWLMRPLKDGIFMNIVGRIYIPYAKMLSFWIIIPLILGYSKLVDLIAKQRLFYVICSAYSALFIVIAFLLAHPTIGLANTETSPKRLLGWIIYLSIESFGSLVVALFWSFVSSSTDTAMAKRGYALILGGAQIGAIFGPFMATRSEFFGVPVLAGFVAVGIFIVPCLIRLFISFYPSAAEVGPSVGGKKTGMIEGLKLLLTRPYLAGILGVSALYEVIGTIIDYQMKGAIDTVYPTAAGATKFLGYFGMSANSLTLVCAFLGTTFFIRKFGLTFCLVMFPVLIGSLVSMLLFIPHLWTFFAVMVAIKGLSYALNNPCKEIMYIPTSKDAKFKAKGWIDMFGCRTAKASGSGINSMFTEMANLAFYGSIISLGIVGVWIVIAIYVGNTNKRLVDTGQTVS